MQDIEKTRDQLLSSVAKLIFGGSLKDMTLHLLSRQRASKRDIEQAEKLRDGMEGKR